ncbi:MAG: Na/Pi cotransporter family protein [Candidatus Pacearchaeota archaeon]
MMQTIIFFVSGIVLFLFGILLLSEKLKNFVKDRITIYLRKITKKPIYGVFFGAVMTALNQSSSATTVLTIALVSSGLLSFYSSLGILFGANIGTTVTVNLVALGITKISFLLIFAGFILFFLRQTKKIGEIIFYIGIVFFGLFLVSHAIASIKSAGLGEFLKAKNPYLALLYSVAFTAIIQSSAITISSAIMLAHHGLLTLPALIAIVLGANIGTTATALIASISSSINGKRTALAHFFFNVFGVLLFLPFLWPLSFLLESIKIPIELKASLFHVFFNITMTFIFLAILKKFSNFIIKLVPGKDESTEFLPYYLDKSFIGKPRKALELVKKELKRQFKLAEKMFQKTLELEKKFDEKKFQQILLLEDAVDSLQGEIASFLDEVSRKNPRMPKEDSRCLVIYSLIVDEIERIADRTLNMAQILRYKEMNKEKLSQETQHFLEELSKKVFLLLSNCSKIFEDKPYDLQHEKEVQLEIKQLREVYKLKLLVKQETPATAMLFSELMVNIERIVSNCSNIAKQMSQK